MLAIRLYILMVCMTAYLTSVSANNDLPDPTKPADYYAPLQEEVYVEEVTEGKKISWRVSVIRISDSDRSAIVNGELVRIGDQVNSSEVLEINPLSVVLNYNDQKLKVRLFNSNVKKEVAN